MDDEAAYPSLDELLNERGESELVTLREHLEVLQQYIDGMFSTNARKTIDSLDPAALSQVPLDYDEEDSPMCVVYFLPDHTMLRVLPDYPFEVQEWEEVDGEDLEDE